jgi:uncharacterized protein YndB with AHSA1/START domain
VQPVELEHLVSFYPALLRTVSAATPPAGDSGEFVGRAPGPPLESLSCHRRRMTEDGGLLLTLTSMLAAPRERVFRMLTEPAELRKWWGPHGVVLLRADVDLRVGGSYRFVMQPSDGAPFHLGGTFLTIDAPAGLSYTFRYEEPTPDDRETVVAVELDDRSRTTLMSVTHGRFATEERLALHRGGWSDSLERLATALQP